MQDFADLTRIQALHQRARRGELRGPELELYSAVMHAYMEALVAHHNRAVSDRQTARRYLRVARSVQVDVTAPAETHRTLTLDCGLGGFSAVLPSPAEIGTLLTAQLKLGPQERVTASVRVADQRRLRGSARVSFAFVEVPDRELDRLEMFIRDAALSRSYWVLAPCPVPLAVPVTVGPRAAPTSPSNEAEDCSFVLVVHPQARAASAGVAGSAPAPAPARSRLEPVPRAACGGSGRAARLSWW